MFAVTGRVKLPSDKVVQTQYGEKRSVLITPDEGQDVRKLDGDGCIRVYKTITHKAIPYMISLSKGDPVTLIYTENDDGKSWYDFLIPASFWVNKQKEDALFDDYNNTPSSSEPRQRPAVQQGRNQQPFVNLNQEQLIIYSELIKENVDLVLQTYQIILSRSREYDLNLSTEDARALASTAFIQSSRTFSKELTLPHPQ